MPADKTSTKRIGDVYETHACQMVQAKGLEIIARNYHAARLGEIDIIATEYRTDRAGRTIKTLVFIEVRARRHGRQVYALGAESITPTKQRKIIQAAQHFMQQHEQFADFDCRFDVIVFDEFTKHSYAHHDGEWIQAAFLGE